jgi:hypothetical protein
MSLKGEIPKAETLNTCLSALLERIVVADFELRLLKTSSYSTDRNGVEV